MKPWQKAGVGLLTAIIGSGLTYQLVSGVNPIYSQLVSAVVALLAGVVAYGLIGFVAGFSSNEGDSRAPVDLPAFKRLFRPLSGLWQWLRVAVAIYLGSVAYAVSQNALVDRRNVQLVAVAVGASIAAAALYWASRPTMD